VQKTFSKDFFIMFESRKSGYIYTTEVVERTIQNACEKMKEKFFRGKGGFETVKTEKTTTK
jgi:hypothetical protein